MAAVDKDQSVLSHIDRLVKEEEILYGKSELTEDDRGRLAELKIELDQCWDLLRQRRALREFGREPRRGESPFAQDRRKLRAVASTERQLFDCLLPHVPLRRNQTGDYLESFRYIATAALTPHFPHKSRFS